MSLQPIIAALLLAPPPLLKRARRRRRSPKAKLLNRLLLFVCMYMYIHVCLFICSRIEDISDEQVVVVYLYTQLSLQCDALYVRLQRIWSVGLRV